MSRKQIFANLAPPPAEPPAEGTSGAPQESPAPRRPSRMRPLIGSPDLIDDGSRSPVGALGQSLGEISERSRRAEEIEKKLTAGQTIVELDRYKKEALKNTWEKVNGDFGQIFNELLPGSFAKLEPLEGKEISEGLEVKVCLGKVWKQSLTELSGGQR